ncbi:MAG: hypothetical protein VKJ64_12790 [Leptolyngbyaceae bacterium]|nr:hypothetical protein [Leptolyngbyaceae bacterium]
MASPFPPGSTLLPKPKNLPTPVCQPFTQSIRQVIYLDYHATTPVDARVGR